MEKDRYLNFAAHYHPTRRTDPGRPNKNIHEVGTDRKPQVLTVTKHSSQASSTNHAAVIT